MQDERSNRSPEAIAHRLASLRSCAIGELKQQTAATLTWTTGAWVQARLASTRSRGFLTGAGSALIIVGLSAIALVTSPSIPIATAWIAWGIAGLGMGVGYTTATLAALESAPSIGEGSASAAIQIASVVGSAVGAGVTGAVVGRTGGSPQAFYIAFVAMVSVAAVALALSPRLSVPPKQLDPL